MVKKRENGNGICIDNHLFKKNHPVLSQKLTFGQKTADIVASFGGSWTFIVSVINYRMYYHTNYIRK